MDYIFLQTLNPSEITSKHYLYDSVQTGRTMYILEQIQTGLAKGKLLVHAFRF